MGSDFVQFGYQNLQTGPLWCGRNLLIFDSPPPHPRAAHTTHNWGDWGSWTVVAGGLALGRVFSDYAKRLVDLESHDGVTSEDGHNQLDP